tara:strand:+ start:997 stop:1656 length:660 start_codon:yes stop_codon:yes gene_type:complete
MARVKQFADDLGISKNQAQALINKGRSRKDGGSQILESVMKPKKYGSGGSNKAPTPKTLRQVVKKGLSDKNPLKFFRENKQLVKRDITERSDEIQSKMNTTGRRSDKGGGPAPKNRKKPKRAVTKKSSEKTIKDLQDFENTKSDITASIDRDFSRKVAKQNEDAMKNVKKTNKKKDGGFPDLTGDGKTTQADILKGRGVPGFSRGGGIAIQGLGFKGVK